MMYSNFYATAAQVLPVILLALIWQSRYLEDLRLQRRHSRRSDRGRDVLFWTKPRVRVYAMTVVTVTLADLVICLLVLAGLVADSVGLRLALIAGLALASVSLLYRMWNEIRDATEPDSAGPPPADEPDGTPRSGGTAPSLPHR